MTRLERYAFWLTLLPVVSTGIVYFWMKYFIESPDPFSVVGHPWQPFVLKAHILTAPLWVLTVGAVAYQHILNRIRSGERRGLRTGVLIGLLVVPMILTGYLIQSLTHQGWLGIVSWSHIILSLAYMLGLVMHGSIVLLQRRGVNTSFDESNAAIQSDDGTIESINDKDAA